MSAIGGILSLSKNKISRDCLLQFHDTMLVQKHRGPDKTTFFAFDFNKNTLNSWFSNASVIWDTISICF